MRFYLRMRLGERMGKSGESNDGTSPSGRPRGNHLLPQQDAGTKHACVRNGDLQFLLVATTCALSLLFIR